ncbi:hypothetical protein AB8880_11340 [Alphaproteobacteria bacterium LSUCC0684]
MADLIVHEVFEFEFFASQHVYRASETSPEYQDLNPDQLFIRHGEMVLTDIELRRLLFILEARTSGKFKEEPVP